MADEGAVTAPLRGEGRRREWLLFAASLLVALAVGELALRASGYHYSPMKVLTPVGPADWRYSHAFESADFTFDPDLIWRPLPGHGVFNTQGFRGQEVRGPKRTGTVRVLAVGDSNTLGHQGVHGANWPLLLETFDARLQVANAGVYGYSSFQGRRRLEETLSLEPDLVLISFGANDGHLVATTDAEYAALLAHRRRLLSLLTRSRLGQLAVQAHDTAEAMLNRTEPNARRVGVAEYRDNLRQMVSLCRGHHAQAVLLTRPFQGHTHDPESWKSLGPDYNQATREIGAELNVPVIDVFKAFKRRRDLFEDESHFTAEGHREAARYVYEALRPLLPPPPAL